MFITSICHWNTEHNKFQQHFLQLITPQTPSCFKALKKQMISCQDEQTIKEDPKTHLDLTDLDFYYTNCSHALRFTTRNSLNSGITLNDWLTVRDVKWSSNFRTSNYMFEFEFEFLNSEFKTKLNCTKTDMGIERRCHIMSANEMRCLCSLPAAVTCRITCPFMQPPSMLLVFDYTSPPHTSLYHCGCVTQFASSQVAQSAFADPYHALCNEANSSWQA